MELDGRRVLLSRSPMLSTELHNANHTLSLVFS